MSSRSGELGEREFTVDARLARQPEHALADDGALDLVGAAGDAVAGRAEHVLVGDVAPTIVEHANRTGCDMICMGTRGMTAMSGLVMGSVATRVLHLARVPVLLVK